MKELNRIPVYFDPWLYVDWIRGDCHPSIERAFNMIETGEFQLRISYLVLMEIYHILSLTYEEKGQRQPEDELHREINDSYQQIKNIFAPKSSDNIIQIDNEFDYINEDNLHRLACKYLKSHSRVDQRFNWEEHTPPPTKYLHLEIAVHAGCTRFITADKRMLYPNSLARRNLLIMDVKRLGRGNRIGK